MNLILLIACIGMIAGFFMVFDISLLAFTENLFAFFTNKPQTIKDEIMEETDRKKVFFLKRQILEAQSVLKLTGRQNKFSGICVISLLMFAGGVSLAIIVKNYFLIPVLSVGFMMLPFWYVKLSETSFKRQVSAELETALSIITTAYLRSEDLITAVEENINYLNPPILNVFERFLYLVKAVDPDVPKALKDMRAKIDNDVFREWCDAMILCQYNRNLKSTLTPIVSKLSDIRIVNKKLDTIIFEPRKEFIIMVALVIGAIPLLYFLNKDWFHALVYTIPGQIVMACCFVAVFVCSYLVIKVTQPIEYRR